jgi:hypothetical protein
VGGRCRREVKSVVTVEVRDANKTLGRALAGICVAHGLAPQLELKAHSLGEHQQVHNHAGRLILCSCDLV